MVTFTHGELGTPASAWRSTIEDLPLLALDDLTRVVVLAAHPDDETLGAGGLVARAHGLGLDVDVVVATRGEGCHPRSPTHPPDRLAALRTAELDEAVELLSPGTRAEILGVPDGAVAEHEADLVVALVERVGDGRTTLLLAPWRGDGHPDHEAVGRTAVVVAERTGARLLEYPVWFWHWGSPAPLDSAEIAPWAAGRRLLLDPDEQGAKGAAIAAHRTQVHALSPAPGDEVLLTAGFLEHFAAPHEVYWELPTSDQALDDLHAADDDPWGVDRRWYEERKRAVLLAMLPRAQFRRAIEVGCSTGALAHGLALRCDVLTAIDSSPSAVGGATRRLAAHPHVDVRLGSVPDDWPTDPAPAVDLVVVSEVGYFLSPTALDGLAAKIATSLAPDGVVVLCHWRHDVVGWPLDGPAVHARLQAAGLPPVAAEYRDRDVEVLVLTHLDEMPSPHA